MPTDPTASRRVLVACAAFKGTLSSWQAGRAVARGLARAGMRPQVLAVSDGGEGLVEALARAIPAARTISVRCRGPLCEPRRARLALLPRGPAGRVKTACIEMASCSGLTLVRAGQRDPRLTTTLGVGDLIRAALDRGARAILLGLGGSATNDGGAGMAQALGARLLDERGRALPPGGAALAQLDRIDASGLDRRLARVRVIALCDVRNRLCGARGASAVYGPQKGATPAQVRQLDRALARFARVLKRDLGADVRHRPGAGAAGGLGAGCLAFLRAELRPGIEVVLDAIGFDAQLRQADLAVTGEGRLDATSLMGKAPGGIAARARRAGVPCVAIGGSVDKSVLGALQRRFLRVEDLSRFAGSRRAALKSAAYWLERLARGLGTGVSGFGRPAAARRKSQTTGVESGGVDWRARRDSNPQPSDRQSDTLTN